MAINLKLNIKNSITKWLFLITTLSLFVFLFLSMVFQSLLFENFYVKKKQEALTESVKNLKLSYSYFKDSDNLELIKSIDALEKKNNAKIAILKTNGEIKYLSNLNNEIDSNTKDIIVNIFNDIMKNNNLLNDLYNNNKIISYTVDTPNINMKNIACLGPISINYKDDSLIIAVSSFRPIQEASEVIKQLYVYMFIFAILMILLLSFVYTKLISKPLVKLNISAQKMSNLDFSEKCEINREDEIGSLAKTLNFLALNLNTALTELKGANKKLKIDIEKEKKLEEMRKEFVAGVSHELKTPITLIEGYAEGLKDNIASEDDKDFYLEVILDEAKKMNTLVCDMIEVSKLDSDNFKLNISNFYINELILKVLRPFKAYVDENKIDLIFNSQPINVSGDEFRIQQVLTNFITNAIRHTKQNGTIIIELEKHTDFAIIWIENTGSHIDESVLPNIWDKFYKTDKSRHREFGGTGLGLSISKNILTLHKSKFGAKNTENGVMFYFTLKYDK